MGRSTSFCVGIPRSHIKLLKLRAVDCFEQPGHDICEDTLLFFFSSVLHKPSDIQVYYFQVKAFVSNASISRFHQLRANQSRWINRTTGQKNVILILGRTVCLKPKKLNKHTSVSLVMVGFKPSVCSPDANTEMLWNPYLCHSWICRHNTVEIKCLTDIWAEKHGQAHSSHISFPSNPGKRPLLLKRVAEDEWGQSDLNKAAAVFLHWAQKTDFISQS